MIISRHRALPLVIALVLILLGAFSIITFLGSPPEKVSAPLTTAPTNTPAENDARADALRVDEVLADLSAKYVNLEGVTVTLGDTPKGEEAVAYYTDGEIVINRAHTVDIQKILAHEIWHVIDWRDNGRLDWGEDLPPANASDYYR